MDTNPHHRKFLFDRMRLLCYYVALTTTENSLQREGPSFLETIQAIILGIIQGLSEFLPISSSAHLILVPVLFGWRHFGIAFDVALHVGTALAVIFYFRDTWITLARAFVLSLYERKIQPYYDRTLIWFLMVATIPGGVAGALGHHYIEEHMRSPLVIATTSIIFGLILLLAERMSRRKRTLDQITLADSLLIGASQSLALIPGVSRSGITISTALLRNFDLKSAAEFSFLLSTPIIAGAALKEAIGLIKAPPMTQSELQVFVLGTLASAITGFLCIKYFLRYVKTHTLLPFVIYRIILGVALFVLYWRAVLQ
jgi:undecaprenyl-diphosphatase